MAKSTELGDDLYMGVERGQVVTAWWNWTEWFLSLSFSCLVFRCQEGV